MNICVETKRVVGGNVFSKSSHAVENGGRFNFSPYNKKKKNAMIDNEILSE